MRLFVNLKKIHGVLGYNYNYHVSSLIYALLKDTEYSSVHDTKYPGKFTFHLETNRSILGKKTDNNLVLIVSSDNEGFLKTLESKLNEAKLIKIQKCYFEVVDTKNVDFQLKESVSAIKVEAITPVNINVRVPGKKYEQYLHPLDDQYILQMKKNMLKKTDGNYTLDDIEIIIPENQKFKERLIDIKGVKVKGHLFEFGINAPLEILNKNINNGFGVRNSQGFGFVNILKTR